MKGLRWGLVPSWARDPKIGFKAINARCETVDTKPMFRAAFKKRSCIVPMSGFFEWKKLNDGGKQPYFIHAPNRSVLLCAGLWEAWKPRGNEDSDWIRTFTILTGPPGHVSGDIHDRQPVILPATSLGSWIDGSVDQARQLLVHLPEADLACYPVSKAVGSVRNQGPDLVQELGT